VLTDNKLELITMPYYHALIKKKEGDERNAFEFDLSKGQAIEIIKSLRQEKTFMLSKFYIKPSEVESVKIVETVEKAVDVLSKGKKKRTLEKTLNRFGPKDTWYDVDAWFIIDSGKDVTKELTRDLASNLSTNNIGIEAKYLEKDQKSELLNPEEKRMKDWKELTARIIDLQAILGKFKVEFIDRDSFKTFCDDLALNLKDLKDICITGYFSETIRTELENIAKNDYYHIRIISPDFQVGTPREKKNLEALRKLSKAGVEVKFNYRIHARLLVAHSPINALLVLGSFDYNTECIGKERYDAGIKTRHPDLVKSAVDFFEQVWNDSETQTLEQFLKDKRISL
jgi:hypothetical protein